MAEAKTEATAADLEDAFGVLHWLLTEVPGTLHAVAASLAESDAMQTAVVANAARGWGEACAKLADACDPKQGEYGGEVSAR
jgi:hypothetical protein